MLFYLKIYFVVKLIDVFLSVASTIYFRMAIENKVPGRALLEWFGEF